MAVILPIISYILGHLAVEANKVENWYPIPYDLTGPANMPFLYAKLLVAAVIAVGVFGAFTIVYLIVYGLMGPPRYGPMDAPPQRRKPSQKRRKFRR